MAVMVETKTLDVLRNDYYSREIADRVVAGSMKFAPALYVIMFRPCVAGATGPQVEEAFEQLVEERVNDVV
ncbi:MAG: hypothetical protein ACTSRU_20630 [Candidatus Hodarchaeales archaeon]